MFHEQNRYDALKQQQSIYVKIGSVDNSFKAVLRGDCTNIMRVLIVDDNEELREFLALSLTESSVDVVIAEDSDDAMRKIESDKFDVLVIDSVMEGGDGIALTQQIRATRAGKNVPILLMSSLSTALARRMATSVGCNEFLVKPFSTMQFVEQVRMLSR